MHNAIWKHRNELRMFASASEVDEIIKHKQRTSTPTNQDTFKKLIWTNLWSTKHSFHKWRSKSGWGKHRQRRQKRWVSQLKYVPIHHVYSCFFSNIAWCCIILITTVYYCSVRTDYIVHICNLFNVINTSCNVLYVFIIWNT